MMGRRSVGQRIPNILTPTGKIQLTAKRRKERERENQSTKERSLDVKVEMKTP